MNGDRKTEKLPNGMEMEYEEKDGIWFAVMEGERNKEYCRPLGKYGRMAEKYWQEHKPAELQQLLIEGIRMETLHRIEERAEQRMEKLQEQMLSQDPIKNPKDTMAAYQHRQRIHDQAEEIVLKEIIFS